MELKHEKGKHLASLVLVLIEPLWNWNMIEPLLTIKLAKVLIEPLWNWNRKTEVSLRKTTGLNRTFMELKHEKINENKKPWTVLIEPLWNWNNCTMAFLPVSFCLNRTFMELKRN